MNQTGIFAEEEVLRFVIWNPSFALFPNTPPAMCELMCPCGKRNPFREWWFVFSPEKHWFKQVQQWDDGSPWHRSLIFSSPLISAATENNFCVSDLWALFLLFASIPTCEIASFWHKSLNTWCVFCFSYGLQGEPITLWMLKIWSDCEPAC